MIDGRTQQLMNLISELKRENQKLRKLLKENQINITYEKTIEEYDTDQGSRIMPIKVDMNIVNQYFARFWGRMDVYGQRVVSKAGKVGYYPQCHNFWAPGCKRRPEYNIGEKKKVTSCAYCSMKKMESNHFRCNFQTSYR